MREVICGLVIGLCVGVPVGAWFCAWCNANDEEDLAMNSSDFIFLVLVPTLAIVLGVGACDRTRLSLLEDDVTSLRKRVNGLELRINRIELGFMRPGKEGK